MNIIAKAMQQANSTNPKQYRAALAALNQPGVAGTYQFDDRCDLKNRRLRCTPSSRGSQSPSRKASKRSAIAWQGELPLACQLAEWLLSL
ncbi:hypothetical protein ACFPAG_16270 [Vogesella sp. GCM10023246]|uniref:Uncharacterized protein n=1 Tax=Vogesella oryzagri TaxID=3160864 RepID=A0ABV1M7H6_9NEIS